MKQVLALLLLRRNQLVQVSEFFEELWADTPPMSAMTTLQTYIYKLRKELAVPGAGIELHTRANGYILTLPSEQLDLCRFERLLAQGREAAAANDLRRGADLLNAALTLWRGEALSGVTLGTILTAYVARLQEVRLRALRLRIEADLQLGRHSELISELRVLVATHPLNEHFYAALMLALHRSGRRFEALTVYRQLRDVLIKELGLEPSSDVMQLHTRILNSDPALDLTPYHGGERIRISSLPPPAQLPADITDFTGREVELAQVRKVIAEEDRDDATARVVCISGMPGVGKTTTAVHAAQLLREHFPDGQLFARLDTEGGANAVLGGFLRAAGLSEDRIPPGIEDRETLFRTWSSNRRVLVVLDNVTDAAQIQNLIPATSRCALIVASQRALYHLPGVRVVQLRPLNEEDGIALLARIVGWPRINAEPQAARRIVELCGGLPVALRSAGIRLARLRAWSLDKLAAQLEVAEHRLDALDMAGLEIRKRYGASYRLLEPRDRSMLRLLSLLPPGPFLVETTARLLGVNQDVAENQLTRLAEWDLLTSRRQPGFDQPVYELHGLVRLYARERLNIEFEQTPVMQEMETGLRLKPAHPARRPVASGTAGISPAGSRSVEPT